MRLARPLLIALAVLLPLTGAASAEARRKATHAERAAIAAKFDAPPKCAKVFVSTVDRHWASYRFDGRTFDDPDCRPAAADGSPSCSGGTGAGGWSPRAAASTARCRRRPRRWPRTSACAASTSADRAPSGACGQNGARELTAGFTMAAR